MQKQLGVWAEQQAAQLMQQQDFQLIARNWHSRYGELDLVMQREQELVFVEVKARAKTGYALAYESVSSAKQRKVLQTAVCFIQKNPQFAHYYYRFDVICFDFNRYFAKNHTA
jgi:TIGR00252 family protein